MAKRRSARGAGLPPNLYAPSVQGGQYRYKHPVTGAWPYVGRDRALAIERANKLNAVLIVADDRVDQILQSGVPSLRQGIERYIADELPGLEIKPNTRDDYQGILERLASAAPAVNVADVSVVHCTETLRKAAAGDRAYMRARTQLSAVFRFLMAEGWTEANYAEMTRELRVKRKRLRLSLDGFQAVRAAAPAWFQRALDVALYSLQREEDLSVLRWPGHDRIVRLEQIKTGSRIEIDPWAQLEAAIAACRDSIICPFIVHKQPEKARAKENLAELRQHFAQVLPEQLSRAFTAARRASGYYDERAHPPTFHEVRSLGADLYRKAGWPEGVIQQLLGHSDIKQTRDYLDGHDAPWVRVSGGGKIG